MTKYLFFTIQSGFPFQSLMKPLQFQDDQNGLSNWILRFPLTIYSSDLHTKHTFESNSVKSCSNYVNAMEEGWKYFVITKNDGTRLYCTSQQKGTLSKLKSNSSKFQNSRQLQSYYLPRCLVLLSNEPYFKMHVNLLKIYRQIQKQSPNISHITEPKLLAQYVKLKQEQKLNQFDYQPQKQGNKSQVETILKYYISKCNQLKNGEAVLVQKRTNLPIMHLYKLKPLKMFQFSHFFNLPISKNNLSQVLTAILLEKQLIVTSNNSNLNVMVIQSLLQLIRPLKWQQHMLVHNLPASLLEVVEESFMPFIIGMQKKCMGEVSTNDKFILFVDEDRFYMPQKLPNIGKVLDDFISNISLPNTANYSNEKLVLQHSIAFMCRLLEPIVRSKSQNFSQFYSEFSQTSLFEGFMSRLNKLQCSELINLISIPDPGERMLEILKQLNKVNSYHQTPKIIYNETEWIEYYLDLNNPNQKEEKRQEQTSKMPSLREIKQNVKNEARQNKMIRRISTMRDKQRSTSIHSPCLKRKIKISGARHEQGSPFLIQLLQERLDTKLV